MICNKMRVIKPCAHAICMGLKQQAEYKTQIPKTDLSCPFQQTLFKLGFVHCPSHNKAQTCPVVITYDLCSHCAYVYACQLYVICVRLVCADNTSSSCSQAWPPKGGPVTFRQEC